MPRRPEAEKWVPAIAGCRCEWHACPSCCEKHLGSSCERRGRICSKHELELLPVPEVNIAGESILSLPLHVTDHESSRMTSQSNVQLARALTIEMIDFAALCLALLCVAELNHRNNRHKISQVPCRILVGRSCSRHRIEVCGETASICARDPGLLTQTSLRLPA